MAGPGWLRRNPLVGGLRYFLFGEPIPARYLILRALNDRFGFMRSYQRKLDFGFIERPHYGHCMLHAAKLARKLGHPRISAIEFGVAGGNGLVAMERHAEAILAETGVEIVVYGFDAGGTGMPPPKDYRDMPYLWQAGYFAMDVPLLRSRLKSAKIILGSVDETLPKFFEQENPPPVGFIAFDLDYYSSTKSALNLFETDYENLLPRVACYFDDIAGDVDYACNEFVGELLAINEFNETHENMKIALVNGLRFSGNKIPREWHEKIFVAHLFDHTMYGRPIADLTQLPLVENRSITKTGII